MASQGFIESAISTTYDLTREVKVFEVPNYSPRIRLRYSDMTSVTLCEKVKLISTTTPFTPSFVTLVLVQRITKQVGHLVTIT